MSVLTDNLEGRVHSRINYQLRQGMINSWINLDKLSVKTGRWIDVFLYVTESSFS